MEEYRTVATLTESRDADISCASLEEAGIPLMVEHIVEDSHAGFRLLVPVEFMQKAARLVFSKPDEPLSSY